MNEQSFNAALRVGIAALLAQLILQLLWHAWLVPTSRAALALAVLPLVPGLWIALYNVRRGLLVGAIASLLYFCHGCAELLSATQAPWLAAAEVAFALVLIAALYGDARSGRRRGRARRPSHE